MNTLETVFRSLKNAQRTLILESIDKRNATLQAVLTSFDSSRRTIIKANEADVDKARSNGMTEALIDRLSLNDARIDSIILGIHDIIRHKNPINKVKASWNMPSGLFIEQVTVPLGVIAVIYESRPEVTIDVFALAYKAGCTVLFCASSFGMETNRAIFSAIKSGLEKSNGIMDSIVLLDSDDTNEMNEILNARSWIDLAIPRGSNELVKYVMDNARVPVIEAGDGNCHIYVDKSANIYSAVNIIKNAKLQKPGTYNAVEKLLVHRDIAPVLMPLLAQKFSGEVELRCDSFSKESIGTLPPNLVLKDVVEEDWKTVFLDYILAVKTVDSLEDAISHINFYGSKHSEAILTEDLDSAQAFTLQVDAACVYTNASTRFTDGGEFGFGAELGVSTQKFHARGPMGLDSLTSIKYHITGRGHIRSYR